MAKKRKKRPRPYGGTTQAGRSQPVAGAATDTTAPPRPGARPGPSRRHKEEARRARELALKRLRRRTRLRRLAVFAVIVAIVAGVFLYFTVRNAATNRAVAAANRAAEAAGCTAADDLEQALDPAYSLGANAANNHLGPGESATYNTVPATSGRHTAGTLSADRHVYTEPVPEETAVHNLEHGYVLLYYRAEGESALDGDVVDRLASYARGEDKVILSPHAALADGDVLAIVAWQRLRTCPAGVTPAQAEDMARGFVADYRSGGGDAPEPNGV